ncbi:MAG: cupin domain-containing protein [Oceanospirillaceae bacterium]|nr:cupin domain-containing protein [Oceanospirillaceae bacterium]
MNVFEYLVKITPQATAHGSGIKYVFKRNEELDSNLTQIAYGKFEPGEVCECHVHPTMDECFYFIKGLGEYQVGDEFVELRENTFLIVHAGVPHRLEAKGNLPLEFVYWGVAL